MKPGLGVTPGHQNGYLRSATCDFKLTFYGNYGPMSYPYEINGNFSRKSHIFPTPVFFKFFQHADNHFQGEPVCLGVKTKLTGSPSNWVSVFDVKKKTRVHDGATGPKKMFI